MCAELRELIDNVNQIIKTQSIKIDPKTHKPTKGELDNITYLSFKYIAGFPMRQVDLLMVQQMTGEINTYQDLNKFTKELAHYLWDHIMGEPESPALEEIEVATETIKDYLYTQSEHDRNCTEPNH